MKLSDRISRRVLPRIVVTQARFDAPARVGAAARRLAGRRGRVELFFAFDDPCSAVAVLDLAERLHNREVDLRLLPVVQRGIAGDPAVGRKRAHAIVDARRLFARRDIALMRGEPLDAAATAFLARWAAATTPGPARRRFCVRALELLWLHSDGPLEHPPYEALLRETTGATPPAETAATAATVARNERAMRRRGGYDTPMAWVHGRLFFAHDRLAQIGERLDDLGWTAAR